MRGVHTLVHGAFGYVLMSTAYGLQVRAAAGMSVMSMVGLWDLLAVHGCHASTSSCDPLARAKACGSPDCC